MTYETEEGPMPESVYCSKRHALILEDVLMERDRQETLKAAKKFKYTCADPELSNFQCYTVLGEEFGEVGRAILNLASLSTDGRPPALRQELIEVMAVAMAWIEGLDHPILAKK